MNLIATNIIDFVHHLSSLHDGHNINITLHRARRRQLWLWWIEAQAHENTATTEWERKLAMAVTAKLGRESIRRNGPQSIDNPEGWSENEAPETRTGATQLPLEVGGTLD